MPIWVFVMPIWVLSERTKDTTKHQHNHFPPDMVTWPWQTGLCG